MAYTDNTFVCNFFVQLKNELLPHDFKSNFTSRLEMRWQMDKEIVTSQSLMDDLSTYNTNLVLASGDWKFKVIKHDQIIVLTTQITELKTEFNETKAAKNAITPAPAPPPLIALPSLIAPLSCLCPAGCQVASHHNNTSHLTAPPTQVEPSPLVALLSCLSSTLAG
jgi:hypothetical protein